MGHWDFWLLNFFYIGTPKRYMPTCHFQSVCFLRLLKIVFIWIFWTRIFLIFYCPWFEWVEVVVEIWNPLQKLIQLKTMAGIIAQLTRAARIRRDRRTYGTNKCLYTLEPFDTNGFKAKIKKSANACLCFY